MRAALSQQTAANAAAAHDAMLQTFQDLLDNLIGRSLTQRLLQAVWDQPSSGDAVQDTIAMNTDKATIKRLETGVPGLDEVLGGGLPEFSFNVIAGPPGCGKTTLAHQLMFALATPERPACISRCWASPR